MFRFVALCALAGCAPSLRAQIVADDDTKLIVEVDLAQTEEARREGLRAYSSLASNQGLLLMFPGPSEVCITNAGVAFAIDAIFVEAREVSAIESFEAQEAGPRCHRADEVLEVAQGVAARVEPGDRLVVD